MIVPTLNSAATIETTLASLAAAMANQGASQLEVVVVDGNSSDGTVERVLNWRAALPLLRVINQQSRGLGAARNEGLGLVSAPLIGFCDADDAWTKDAVEIRLGLLSQFPKAVAVTGQVEFVALDGERTGAPIRRRPGTRHPGYTPGAILTRREILEIVGRFDEGLHVGADSDWILRAIMALGGLPISERIVLRKGLRVGSLSTDTATYRQDMLQVARRFVQRKKQLTVE